MFNILNNKPPEIWGEGSQSRDFIYVEDTIDAIMKLYNKLQPKESINISTDGQITIKQIIKDICDFTNYDFDKIIYKPTRQSDVECHSASNAKIKSMINYQLTPFKVGLEQTINWYLKTIKT
jgi:UDP-glucose 4-epimerase